MQEVKYTIFSTLLCFVMVSYYVNYMNSVMLLHYMNYMKSVMFVNTI